MSETVQTLPTGASEKARQPGKLRRGVALAALGGIIGGGVIEYVISHRPSPGVELSVTSDGTTEQFNVTDTFPAVSVGWPTQYITETEVAGSINCLEYQDDVNGAGAVQFSVIPSTVTPSQVEMFKEEVGDACDGSVPDPNAQNWIFSALGQAGIASNVVSVS
jgi:hypothetical protein